MIHFACLQCGLKFQVKDEFAGRSTVCPTCKQPLVVPTPTVETKAYIPPEALRGSSLNQVNYHGGVWLGDADKALAHNSGQTGRYVVDKEIARGGMGAVSRAIDRDLRREVAVKYMLDMDNAHQRERFLEEAQITGQLEHPHIVPIHELGVDHQNRLFFSM